MALTIKVLHSPNFDTSNCKTIVSAKGCFPFFYVNIFEFQIEKGYKTIKNHHNLILYKICISEKIRSYVRVA